MKKKVSIFNKTYVIQGKDGDQYFNDIPSDTPFYESYFPFLYQIVEDDSVCLDIGANIGLISLAISQLNPKSKVYSFEPTPEIFNLLKSNIEANSIKNIVPSQLALSDKKQKLNFINVNNYSAGNFSLNPEFSGKRKEVFGEYIQVQADTLDSWMEKNKLKKLDFIKLDVEGSELQVLKGAKKTLQKYRPYVAMEFNSYCYILFQNKTPMDALDEIMTYFDEVYKLNKNDSTLQRIPNTPKAKNEFIDSSLRNGFVDDFICLPKGRELPQRDVNPYSLQRENTQLKVEMKRILDSKSWKIASFLQKIKKSIRRNS